MTAIYKISTKNRWFSLASGAPGQEEVGNLEKYPGHYIFQIFEQDSAGARCCSPTDFWQINMQSLNECLSNSKS
jgi:hypothetical protein